MDFQQELTKAVNNLVASGKIEKMIEEQVQKTVDHVIQEQLRPYSDFSKKLEKVIKESVQVGDDLDLPSYGHLITNLVRRNVRGYMDGMLEKQLVANLEELFEKPPAEIKFSELVEKYVEQLKDEVEAGCVCYGDDHHIHLKVRESHGTKYIELSEKCPSKNDSYHRPDITIGVGSDGKVWHLAFSNEDVEKKLFTGPLYNFEKMVFQMKAMSSKIVFDCDPDDIDTNYGPYED